MTALCLQYDGFRLMLDSQASNNVFPVQQVMIDRQSCKLQIVFAMIDSSDIAEAYAFAPLRYWQSIHHDALYPNNYPYNLMPSINSGTAVLDMSTSVMDGIYDYYYRIKDDWYKASINIIDNRVVSINNVDIMQAGILCNIISNDSNLDINITVCAGANKHYGHLDIPAKIQVAQHSHDDLYTSIEVCKNNYKLDNLNTKELRRILKILLGLLL